MAGIERLMIEGFCAHCPVFGLDPWGLVMPNCGGGVSLCARHWAEQCKAMDAAAAAFRAVRA